MSTDRWQETSSLVMPTLQEFTLPAAQLCSEASGRQLVITLPSIGRIPASSVRPVAKTSSWYIAAPTRAKWQRHWRGERLNTRDKNAPLHHVRIFRPTFGTKSKRGWYRISRVSAWVVLKISETSSTR